MTEFDDFEWVDPGSTRAPGQAHSGDKRQPRDHPKPRDNSSSSGSTGSQGSARSGKTSHPSEAARTGAPRPKSETRSPTGTAPTGGSSRARPPARSGAGTPPRKPGGPRPTLWSRVLAGLRKLPGRIARLPRPVLIAAGGLLFLIVLTMVIDSALYYNKVHAGVSVAGQGLSGNTADEAAGLVAQQVQEARAQPITLVSGTRTWEITPEELDLDIDMRATASAALDVTRKSNFVADMARKLKLYFDGHDLPLIGTMDETKFDTFLAQVSGDLDVRPVNAGLIIQDDFSMTPVEGESGYVVDQDRLREQLLGALFSHDATEIQVPMMRKPPDILAADSEPAIAQVETMLSDSVDLEYIGLAPPPTTTTSTAPASESATTSTSKPEPVVLVKTTLTWTFSPSEMAAYIDFKAEDVDGVLTLVPYISAEKMAPFLVTIESPMKVEPVDAEFTSDGANVWVKEMVLGKGLDHEGTALRLTEAALRSTNRTAEAIFMDIEPDFTTQDALDLNITDQLGRYHTHFKSIYEERDHNVRKATQETADKLLAPGEEYSFEAYLSERTEENKRTPENPDGWDKGIGIVDGELTEGILGGGICQVSTTLFNAALLAGLEITERWNHTLFIERYPPGLDATVTAGGAPKDLRFVNNTPGYIWIYGQSDGTDTTFIIFGTDDGREVRYDTLGPYDVVDLAGATTTVLRDYLPFDSTTILSFGQDEMKYRVTRYISWPNGSTTTDTFFSQWYRAPIVVAMPTSSTATTTTTLPGATTTAPGGT